jgi:hypothetical protein
LYMIYSLSHTNIPPICKDPNNPAIRFYGGLQTIEECRSYVEEVRSADPNVSLFIGQTQKWIVACSTPARNANGQYIQDKLCAIATAHIELRKLANADFKANMERVDEAGTAGIGNEECAVSPDAKNRRREAHSIAEYKPSGSRLPSALCMDGQDFAVVAFSKDVTAPVVNGSDDPEPAFMYLASFPTEADCDRYVRNVAADHLTDQALDVVSMRKWIFLEDNVGVIYRHDELTNFMRQKKTDASNVDTFRHEQALEGDVVDIQDLPNDLVREVMA